MAEYVSLLVVEDNETEVREWEKEVERRNVDKDKPFEIEVTFADSKLTAERMIQTHRFDAAVVDLRLKLEGTGQGHNNDGNEVVRTLASGEMAAVAVFTGQRTEAEEFDSPNIDILVKGEGLDVAFKWLAKHSEIIFAVRKAGKIIANDMALTFHRSIWPRWQQWNQGVDGPKNFELPLARHLVSHVYTQLLQRSEKVHPEEHYYVPPIPNSEVSTGDLIRNSSGEIEVIITPRCDAAHPGKTKTLQLAACLDISKEWNGLLVANTPASQSTIKQWKQHDRKEVQHFIQAMTLEPGKSLGPWFVRFDRIRSIDLGSDECKELKTLRFASISSDFLPSLVQRLGAFFSRIGTPDM